MAIDLYWGIDTSLDLGLLLDILTYREGDFYIPMKQENLYQQKIEVKDKTQPCIISHALNPKIYEAEEGKSL